MLEARPANRSNSTPEAPGGAKSPQRPGMTPDRSTIPGHHFIQAPKPLGAPIRPATEYLTAEELADLLPTLNEIAEPGDFEQSGSAYEEMRKAYPWKNPPIRPTAWFTFSDAFADSDPALAAGTEALALAQQSLATE